MTLAFVEQLGNWNPQLVREIKGRLKIRNVAITAAISVCGQLLLYFYYLSLLPADLGSEKLTPKNRYCLVDFSTIPRRWYRPLCIQDALGNWDINWQLWWLDLFVAMSVIGIFALLVVGTYMLISDLSREERRGTLDFIRMSPQSATGILAGKILGVPILLYLFGALAIPLHLTAGLGAKIPLSLICSFYVVLALCCMLFYSGALLHGLVSSSLGGFQAWLGSGAILFFLSLMSGNTLMAHSDIVFSTPADWFTLFYPGTVLTYLVDATGLPARAIRYLNVEDLARLQWFGLSLWKSAGIGISLTLLNYGLWTFWIWQGLKRRFHNPSVTLLSKQQSYGFSVSFTVVMLGFALQTQRGYDQRLFENFGFLFFFNLVLFLGLIAALSPHRQTLHDWARYRHQNASENRSIIKDLLWGSKSPSTVAIGLNLVVTSAILLPLILIVPLNQYKIPLTFGLVLTASLILIYASITQLMLLMKTRKRVFWAAGTVSILTILPFIIFALLRIDPVKIPSLWLFSAMPVAATQYAATTTVLISLLVQWLAIALIGFQIQRQLQKAGESATKALLSER